MSCRPRPTKSHLEEASKLEIEDALQGRNRERKGGTGNEVLESRGSTTLSSPPQKKKAQPFFCYFHFLLLFLRASPPPLDKLGRGGGSFQKPSSSPPPPTSQGSSSFQQWDPQMKVDIRPPLRYFKPFSPSCVYFYSPPPPPYLVV